MRHALAAAAVCCLVAAPAAAAQEPLPPQGPPPPGANDFACKPPARHPYPVVLVHGTFLNMQNSWTSVAPALERLGYCVFALDYGNGQVQGSNGVGDIPTSARQLKTFVDQVLAATGAAKVSLVGHSQGGMMPRYWIKFLGGADKVDDLIGFSPSNHGTTNPLAGPAGGAGCPACAQQVAGSAFITELNAGDQTPPPGTYTVVQTSHDEVVTPFDSAFLPAGGRVTNVLLQDKCPADTTEHIGMPYDPVAIQWMLAALGRAGPAPAGFEPDCTGRGVDTFPDSDSTAGSGSGPPGAAASLVIGHVPRSAATTGRRRMRVAVKARGAKVLHAVASLRTARGKAVGRSSSVTVSSRRAVVVKLSQRLRPGRYTLAVQGRDSESGHTVRATRAIRLR
jgi:triacylglycerol esterase/lipase EstA (alpha/beta hydrolase family)